MGNRLSKIYTRTGDNGTTGLGDGTRVPKDHLRVEAYGSVDELNSVVGLLLSEPLPVSVRTLLIQTQHDLFNLGGELCIPGHHLLSNKQVDKLEAAIDRYNADLPALKEFILPGGNRCAALCHHARTVCRRAERRTFSLSQQEQVPPTSLQYLNRLSDLLFVLARHLNKISGIGDILWDRSNTDR